MRQKNSIVVVYENALLGEGISRYILTHAGVRSRLVPALNREGIKSALASHPQVLILGLEDPFYRIDLETLDSRTMVIDIRDDAEHAPTIPSESVGMERIVRAVQSLKGRRARPISM